jgi:Family of unknown function (DUF6263)
MPRPRIIVGIVIVLIVGDMAWAGEPLGRCGRLREVVCHRRFAPRILARRGRPRPCPSPLDESVWLCWKFEVGKPFYQEMTTETKLDMKVMGQSVTHNQKVTFYMSWNPVACDKDGNWTVKQKIEGVKMDVEIGGNKVPFDSTEKGGGGNPLVGSEFTLTIDKTMSITKVEGRDECLKKLIEKNKQDDPLLKIILDEALKQMSESLFSVVPEKPVKKGDSWTKTSLVKMGPIASLETNYQYTYEGPDESRLQKIKIETTMKYNPPGPNADGPLPFKIVKADLSSKELNGRILFDATKGRVRSSDITMHLTGTLTLEIGGMASEVTLDQTQTTKVKIRDVNPMGRK